jgi:hypothetical protein
MKNVYLKSYSTNKKFSHGSNTIKSGNHLSRKDHFRTSILEFIKGFLGHHHQHSRRAFVAHVLWEILDGVLKPHFLTIARKYFWQHVFTPFNILKEMDSAGGTLSYEGIDVICQVETSGLKRLHGCMIPSKSKLRELRPCLNGLAKGIAHSV